MLFHSIRLNRFLSFGESTEATPLRALNLVIGPNGSGKSNMNPSVTAVAAKLPDEALQEDEKLLPWYEQALTRLEAQT